MALPNIGENKEKDIRDIYNNKKNILIDQWYSKLGIPTEISSKFFENLEQIVGFCDIHAILNGFEFYAGNKIEDGRIIEGKVGIYLIPKTIYQKIIKKIESSKLDNLKIINMRNPERVNSDLQIIIGEDNGYSTPILTNMIYLGIEYIP